MKKFFAFFLMIAFTCAMGTTIGCGKKEETKKEPAATKKDEPKKDEPKKDEAKKDEGKKA